MSSRTTLFLVEKSNLIRSLNILLSTSGDSKESIELINCLITDIETSIEKIIHEYNNLYKLSSIFDSEGIKGEVLVENFLSLLIASVILESTILHNSNLCLRASALVNLTTKTNKSLELFFKLLNQPND